MWMHAWTNIADDHSHGQVNTGKHNHECKNAWSQLMMTNVKTSGWGQQRQPPPLGMQIKCAMSLPTQGCHPPNLRLEVKCRAGGTLVSILTDIAHIWCWCGMDPSPTLLAPITLFIGPNTSSTEHRLCHCLPANTTPSLYRKVEHRLDLLMRPDESLTLHKPCSLHPTPSSPMSTRPDTMPTMCRTASLPSCHPTHQLSSFAKPNVSLMLLGPQFPLSVIQAVPSQTQSTLQMWNIPTPSHWWHHLPEPSFIEWLNEDDVNNNENDGYESCSCQTESLRVSDHRKDETRI
jgi:hypothetical protein